MKPVLRLILRAILWGALAGILLGLCMILFVEPPTSAEMQNTRVIELYVR